LPLLVDAGLEPRPGLLWLVLGDPSSWLLLDLLGGAELCSAGGAALVVLFASC